MNSLGLLDAIRAHPLAMKPLFVASEDQLTAQKIIDIMVPTFSDRESNLYMKETETLAIWCDYLHEVEGKRPKSNSLHLL